MTLFQVVSVYLIINVTNAKKDIFKKIILQFVKSAILQNALNARNNQINVHRVLKINIYLKINVLTSVQVDILKKLKIILIFVINVIIMFVKNVKIKNNIVQYVKTMRILYIRVNV